ncbi:MAG: hypothetical protein ACPGVU_17025 [Limisphaerales bacterium]
MKPSLLSVCSLLLLTPPAFAGGNTSIVEIDKVTEIKVEAKKITIKGSGVVKRRIISTPEKEDSKVFGRPAQWFHAKVDEAVFEVVPYFAPGIQGVPTGGHSAENLKRLSTEWWVDTHAKGSRIKKGDRLTISYQGDVTTLNGVFVTKIVGYGAFLLPEPR